MLNCLVGELVYKGGGEDGGASLYVLVESRDSSSRSPKENVRLKPAIAECDQWVCRLAEKRRLQQDSRIPVDSGASATNP